MFLRFQLKRLRPRFANLLGGVKCSDRFGLGSENNYTLIASNLSTTPRRLRRIRLREPWLQRWPPTPPLLTARLRLAALHGKSLRPRPSPLHIGTAVATAHVIGGSHSRRHARLSLPRYRCERRATYGGARDGYMPACNSISKYMFTSEMKTRRKQNSEEVIKSNSRPPTGARPTCGGHSGSARSWKRRRRPPSLLHSRQCELTIVVLCCVHTRRIRCARWSASFADAPARQFTVGVRCTPTL